MTLTPEHCFFIVWEAFNSDKLTVAGLHSRILCNKSVQKAVTAGFLRGGLGVGDEGDHQFQTHPVGHEKGKKSPWNIIIQVKVRLIPTGVLGEQGF